MTTFDEILPRLNGVFAEYAAAIEIIGPILINRDLNGRVRLLVEERVHRNLDASVVLDEIAAAVSERLGPHAPPPQQLILFEDSLDDALSGHRAIPLEGVRGVQMVDRLATESNWASIADPTTGPARVVFYSIKGGVGRSTALAAAAWYLAESGRRVLVIDMDLESPGLSTSLLPTDRRPRFGVADWLVEDLVDNGDAVFEDLAATSLLSRDGEIRVVPAHGVAPGDYIAKLGRVWMPKMSEQGREGWPGRAGRLLIRLEERWTPDVVLIDSRAGIDEVAAACVTDLAATSVLLFAVEGQQTWSGYDILFQAWLRSGVAAAIRERLQVVGAMMPDIGRPSYLEALTESAWESFRGALYDEVPAGQVAGDQVWSFDLGDLDAPHHPWPIEWHRGFAAVRSLHDRLSAIDREAVDLVFGRFLRSLDNVIDNRGMR